MVNEKYYGYGTAPSPIRELFNYGLAKAKEVGRENIFDYSLGNPSIPAPKIINDTIRRLLDTEDPIKLHGYSMNAGFEATREAVAANLSRRFGCNAKAGEIYMTAGAAPALAAVSRAVVASNEDEILIVAPFFPEYRVIFGATGAQVKITPADTEHFQINLEALEQMLSPHTAALVLNSPNNPCGAIYTEQTLRKVGALLEKKSAEYGRPIYIISDEPYRELVYGGIKVPFTANIYPNTIVCYSWSKSLSLPGERIGYVYVNGMCQDGDKIYAAAIGASREYGQTCASTLWQRVIAECVDEMPNIAPYEENRNLLYRALTEYGYTCVKPDGAFYLFVKAPGGDSKAFSQKAKLEHNLLAVPADGFGCPGYLRLSYCVSRDMIQRSLPALKALVESYR